MKVDRFGHPPDAPTVSHLRIGRPRRAVVRVTHASVGVTDVMAVEGEYLMQPFTRFVPGYDFVGVVEHLPGGGRGDAYTDGPTSAVAGGRDRWGADGPAGAAAGDRGRWGADGPTGPSANEGVRLAVGQRVAGVLPRMGAHATLIAVAPQLLVPVPEGLEPAIAATVPLDAVTARFSLDALDALDLGDGAGPSVRSRRSVLVQGAGGAVGSWAVQMASARGRTVLGTASSRSRDHAGTCGAEVFDYRDPTWIDQVRRATGGGVDGAIDHTGSRLIRGALAPGGRIVRTAFGSVPGRQRRATAAGFMSAALQRFADPSERVCSVPILVAARRAAYRRALAQVLDSVSRGDLVAPEPDVFPLARYGESLAAAARPAPGTKAVLALTGHDGSW